jgi:prophage tail gpP-like protein
MITLEVNSISLTGFTSIDVTRRLDTISGDFTFQAVSTNNLFFPIQTGDSVRVVVDGTPVITGFAEYINVNYSSGTHIVMIRGRDVTCDLIDSTLGDTITFTGGVTLEQVIRGTLDSLGLTNIGVVSNVTLEPFGPTVIIASEIGEKGFDFLEKYARQMNVLLTTDGLGNVVISRSSNVLINTFLLNVADDSSATNSNNILEGGVTNDMTGRYNTYIVRSGQSLVTLSSFDDFEDVIQNDDFIIESAIENQGQAQDVQIRPTRIYDFQAEHPSDNNQCLGRAEWEANYRRAKSFDYYCTVYGFTAINDGFIWSPNLLVKVIDDFCNVDAQLLIEQVRYTYGVDTGSKTQLTLVTQDAYQPQPNRTPQDEQANIQSEEFVKIDPSLTFEDIQNLYNKTFNGNQGG